MNRESNFDRLKWGRIVGQASALICGLSSLAFAAYVWISFPKDRSVSWVMLAVFAVAVFAFYAATRRRTVLLVVAFAITFFPVGLYLGEAFQAEDDDDTKLFLFTIGAPF